MTSNLATLKVDSIFESPFRFEKGSLFLISAVFLLYFFCRTIHIGEHGTFAVRPAGIRLYLPSFSSQLRLPSLSAIARFHYGSESDQLYVGELSILPLKLMILEVQFRLFSFFDQNFLSGLQNKWYSYSSFFLKIIQS